MYDILMLTSGVFWTAVYIMIIRLGFRDKTYGMPIAALSANISWEFIFSFIYPAPAPQIYVNYVWFAFDLIIVWQFFRYGRSEIRDLSKSLFAMFSIVSLSAGFSLVLLISQEFEDYLGAYAAFGQNLLMSILFIMMLYRRDNVRGQSIYIAIAKCIGTVTPSLAFYYCQPRFNGSDLMTFLYVSIFFFDIVYILQVYQACIKQGIRPWSRV